MAHKVVFEIETHDDTDIALSPGMYGACKGSMDHRFHWPAACPDQYVLGSMRGSMLEWLATSPLKGKSRMGFDQQREGDLRFTRSLWVEFDELSDALLFRLTWGCETSEP
ncbi:hypothetical protein [Methylobacterium sp. SD21]|uniref:hypothetical protein n=1 Tax=Methylobacterium litchii TaxID=3138810 RepID=UPI00313AAA33